MAEVEEPTFCDLGGDISSCPSARVIKVLLKRLDKWMKSSNVESEPSSESKPKILDSLCSVFDEHNYSVTELMNDLNHIKYEHGVDRDDAKFDAAFEFFKDSMTGIKCNVNECPLVQRHFRDRGRVILSGNTSNIDHDSQTKMDAMAMAHCYFLHSFDINRLTKEERDRVELELTVGIGLKSLDDDDDTKINGVELSDDENDDDDVSQSKRALIINGILNAKRKKLRFGRNDGRYRDIAEDEKSDDDQRVDFETMAQTVGIDAAILREGLSEYVNGHDRLIGDLIDVVYSESTTFSNNLSKLNVEKSGKEALFRRVLHDHFKSTQLSTENFLRLSRYIVTRKDLVIGYDALKEVVTTEGIDGRMFDKTDKEHYRNMGSFSKLFKPHSDCKAQHVRQLYRLMMKWKYIEPKEKTTGPHDDAKQPEKEPVASHSVVQSEDIVVNDESDSEHVDQVQQEVVGMVDPDKPQDVYEIGRRFYFWDSHQKHPDYVASKYKNMKEEVLENPLLNGLITVEAWNALTAVITALLATEIALQICSNGQSVYMYGIQKLEPFEAQHLRALKLYTDFTDLCAKFCEILRSADPKLIAGIAHWTRNLIETVQCFGSSLNANAQRRTYYRGVDRAFIFKMIATRFNLPLSTTSQVRQYVSKYWCFIYLHVE